MLGVAGGPRIPVSTDTDLVVGPEIFGETAFRAFLSSKATGVEALLTGRIEGRGDAGAHLRIKAGAGGGIHPEFGAPEWRAVVAVETYGRVR